jgi:adenine-specific DNA-methyltransferase
MNTLNYIGCKHKLFATLYSIFSENVPDLMSKSFSDLFMGTGVVSYNMLDKCRSVHSNDLETYSYIIGNAILKCNYSTKLKKLIDGCNKKEGVEGLIYKYYAPNNECERMFFTVENAKKADAIRIYIQELYNQNKVTKDEYHFLLASLLTSIDKVANTTSVYGAYLKQFKASSQKEMVMEPIHTNKNIDVNVNSMTQGFAEDVCDDQKVDVTYLDPPYNQRSYSANYFVLNFIALYDDKIIPKGKTGLIDKNQSEFCSKVRIKEAFTKLIDGVHSPYIFLSYNNEGLLSEDDIKNILMKKGFVKLYKIKYNKFKAQKKVDVKYVYEYLWFVDTSKERGFEECKE